MDLTGFETLAEYPSSLADADGTLWIARARGRRRIDGLWEALLEFEREDGAAVVRTERETTQPNRTDLLYWAAGLAPVYLEGAFGRASASPRGEDEEHDVPKEPILASNTPPALASMPATPATAEDVPSSTAGAR